MTPHDDAYPHWDSNPDWTDFKNGRPADLTSALATPFGTNYASSSRFPTSSATLICTALSGLTLSGLHNDCTTEPHVTGFAAPWPAWNAEGE